MSNELQELVNVGYVPSSLERKRAVLMYFFIGILISISKPITSPFELFHLKQAIGWRLSFIVRIMMSIIFLFIPYIYILPILGIIVFLGVVGMFIYQARNGVYSLGNKTIMPVFYLFGSWLFSLFELDKPDQDQLGS